MFLKIGDDLLSCCLLFIRVLIVKGATTVNFLNIFILLNADILMNFRMILA